MAGWLKGVDLNNVDDTLAAQIIREFDKDHDHLLDQREAHAFIVEWCQQNSKTDQEKVFKAFWENAIHGKDGEKLRSIDIVTAVKAAPSELLMRLRLDNDLQVPLNYAVLSQPSHTPRAHKWIAAAINANMCGFPMSLLKSHMLVDDTGKAVEDHAELRGMSVKFIEKWGANSWKVEYSGNYKNGREKHVEVGAANMNKYKAGSVFTLTNKHVQGNAIMYDVSGCNNGTFTAHFTVYYGSDPTKKFHDF